MLFNDYLEGKRSRKTGPMTGVTKISLDRFYVYTDRDNFFSLKITNKNTDTPLQIIKLFGM